MIHGILHALDVYSVYLDFSTCSFSISSQTAFVTSFVSALPPKCLVKTPLSETFSIQSIYFFLTSSSPIHANIPVALHIVATGFATPLPVYQKHYHEPAQRGWDFSSLDLNYSTAQRQYYQLKPPLNRWWYPCANSCLVLYPGSLGCSPFAWSWRQPTSCPMSRPGSRKTLRAISSFGTRPFRIELDLVTTAKSLRGRDCAIEKAKRIILSMPTAVKIATSVAISQGWPRCKRPPLPAYLGW